ncbi:HyaD/HybD family hydrogenase maturation endopeptidase [Pseudodesulfovibrio tunisiensis]|uniref:HyaD/HybD family hydrogenase maturation endopeptidase n=1 Tax=Pseudodesulfovibrio tunisiensis TaxID=463192 RepID=UPI001FB48288|nr:HyaD/HybD family hydrogenase maturation endopeptidase [Pseudodesulfovibrio tunisiensis]
MADTEKRILVLGVGNVLFSDEGFGVRVAEELDRDYVFSSNVEVMDGGTLGLRLMGPIMESDYLILVDIVMNDGSPGEVFRLLGQDLEKACSFQNSMHQTDLLDTLAQCNLVGTVPEDVILYGVEPKDFTTMSTALSPELEAVLGKVKETVLEEIRSAGGEFAPRTSNNPSTEKVYVPRDTC